MIDTFPRLDRLLIVVPSVLSSDRAPEPPAATDVYLKRIESVMIPTTPDDISAEWIQSALVDAGHSVEVTSVAVQADRYRADGEQPSSHA